MEINAYNDLNTSNISTNTKSTTTYNTSTSLFNSLIAQNSGEKKVESSTAESSLKDRVKDAIDNLTNDFTMTSSDATNTHDELTLMLAIKNMQAS